MRKFLWRFCELILGSYFTGFSIYLTSKAQLYCKTEIRLFTVKIEYLWVAFETEEILNWNVFSLVAFHWWAAQCVEAYTHLPFPGIQIKGRKKDTSRKKLRRREKEFQIFLSSAYGLRISTNYRSGIGYLQNLFICIMCMLFSEWGTYL